MEAVTHVNVLLARSQKCTRTDVLSKVCDKFAWKRLTGSFSFRGREIALKVDNIYVTMEGGLAHNEPRTMCGGLHKMQFRCVGSKTRERCEPKISTGTGHESALS